MDKFSPVTLSGRIFSIARIAAIAVLPCLIFMVTSVEAQITPKQRDRTYKQAAPGRFDERFEAPTRPKSTVVPVKPDTLKPIFPGGLDELEFDLKRLVIKGVTVYRKRQLLPLYRNFINKKVTLAHIYRIAHAITRKYRNDGYILSQAVVPPQKIQNGVVRIQVLEGYIHRVKIKGEVRGPRNLLNAYRKRILASRPLRAKDLERYLLLIEDLPGVSVKSVLEPSQKISGTSKLTVILENKPYDASLGMDNRGSKFNGPIQIFAGAGANSPFRIYDRLGILGVIAEDPDELLFVNAYYDLPLSKEGTRLSITGAISQSKPGSSLKQFNVEGDSRNFSFRFSHPYIRSRGENLKGHFGFSYKDSETDILGTRDSEDRLRILDIGVSYDYADRFRGVNLVSFQLDQGLNFLDATESGSPNLSRASGKSDFTKLSGHLVRLQQLAPSWMLLGAASWQYSLDKLLAVEEFGVGGPRFGRAYDSSEITGDHGFAFKLELQKAFRFRNKFLKSLQGYVFYDFGSVWNKVATASGETQNDISSAGIGVRYNLSKWISGYLEFDKPLDKDVAAEGNRDSRLFFSLSANF